MLIKSISGYSSIRTRIALRLLHHAISPSTGAASINRNGGVTLMDKLADREKSLSIAAHYFQSTVKHFAKKEPVSLTPAALLYTPLKKDNSHLIDSAKYLHHELPIRIARRIEAFHTLPFIVGSHPAILNVLEQYMTTFKVLVNFPPIKNMEDEQNFTGTLQKLLDEHRDVITNLAIGFQECRRHLQADEELIRSFLNSMLTSRLAIRILAEHHVGLHEIRDNYVGIVATKFQPKMLIDKRAKVVQELCESRYGMAPEIRMDGRTEAQFPYITMPMEYIIGEVLKNSMRATCRYYKHRSTKLSPIQVTIASNSTNFVVRISDKGGGVPHDIINRIWEYNFTTAEEEEQESTSVMPFMDAMAGTGAAIGGAAGAHGGSSLHGFGFGLPTSKSYANFLGGSLTLQTMPGIGTDVYLELKHIQQPDQDEMIFRI